jgi:hypothetical protein
MTRLVRVIGSNAILKAMIRSNRVMTCRLQKPFGRAVAISRRDSAVLADAVRSAHVAGRDGIERHRRLRGIRTPSLPRFLAFRGPHHIGLRTLLRFMFVEHEASGTGPLFRQFIPMLGAPFE